MKHILNRRDFLQRASTATVGLTLLRFQPMKAKYDFIDNLGVQLYTVRDALQSDPMGTLQAIKEAGYKQVELHDTGLLAKLGPTLQDLGLAVNSSHFPSPYVTGNWAPMEAFGAKKPDKGFDAVVEEAANHKLRFLVFPFLFPQDRGGLDVFKSLSEKLNKAGEQCKKAGIGLCYHNHAFEFQPMEDTSPFQILYKELDPDLVNFEVDVFWVSVAGNDPAAFIQKHKDRIRMLHLKDKKKDTQQSYKEMTMPKESFQPVGQGTLDFKKILAAAKEANIVYAFVEQDQSPDPLADIKKSIGYLKNLNA